MCNISSFTRVIFSDQLNNPNAILYHYNRSKINNVAVYIFFHVFHILYLEETGSMETTSYYPTYFFIIYKIIINLKYIFKYIYKFTVK